MSGEGDQELDLLDAQLRLTCPAEDPLRRLSGNVPLWPSRPRYASGAAVDEDTVRGETGSRVADPSELLMTFSTHPRRRLPSKSLMTLWADKHLLDEMQSAQVKRVLDSILQWDFNAFTLDRLSQGQNLATLCSHLFQANGLTSTFRLDAVKVWKFFSLVEQSYHATNPYHNGVHAADVTQAMACFLAEPALRGHLRPVEVLSAIVAAVCHDVDHPGFNEKFLVASGNHLAGLYNNSSVLENHHWRSAISLLRESGMVAHMDPRDRQEIEDVVRGLILATDISRQSEFLALFRQHQESGLDMSRRECRHFVLQIAIKCADISNPCRPWSVCRLWSLRACEEFFRQGDRERDLEIPVTQICDRNSISIAKVRPDGSFDKLI